MKTKLKTTCLRLLSASLMSLALSAQGATLLVGSYTEGASKGIYRYQFDPRSGQIEPVPLQVVESVNPSWLALSADQRRVFAVNEDREGKVSSFAVDGNGTLTPLNQVASDGGEPTHASISHDQRYLFVANYGAQAPGGSLVALPLARDGTLKAAVQQLRHEPSQINRERQTEAHVHAAVLSADGRHLYASDLGADKLFIYRYDGASASQPLSPATSAAVSLPAGSGPRHLLFDGKGKHAYLTLEMSAEVVMFDVEDGVLVQRQRLPLTEKQTPSAKAAAGLHLSADGRFLYVSNRGDANQIVVYGVDRDSGRLSLLQRRASEGDHPREFALAPGGHFLLVANQNSNEIVVLRRDPLKGTLGEVVQRLPQPAPSALVFAE